MSSAVHCSYVCEKCGSYDRRYGGYAPLGSGDWYCARHIIAQLYSPAVAESVMTRHRRRALEALHHSEDPMTAAAVATWIDVAPAVGRVVLDRLCNEGKAWRCGCKYTTVEPPNLVLPDLET